MQESASTASTLEAHIIDRYGALISQTQLA